MKSFFVITCLIFLSCKGICQSGYSQFYNTPLFVNPASTGQFNKSYRLGIASRNGIIAPNKSFTQSTFFIDKKIFGSKLSENDCLGIGIVASVEKNPDDGIKNSYIGASVSYQKALNEDGRKSISAGFQANLGSKLLEKSGLLFESQIPAWINSGFRNIDITQFGRANFSYVDLNAGLIYQGTIGSKNLFSIGTSIYHINKPYKQFLGGEFSLLSQMWNKLSFERRVDENQRIHALVLIGISDGALSDFNTGFIYQYRIKHTTEITAGLFWKKSKIWGNSLVPTVGIGFNSLSINLSYDLNAFSKNTFVQKAGEISVIYTRAKTKESFSETRFIRF